MVVVLRAIRCFDSLETIPVGASRVDISFQVGDIYVVDVLQVNCDGCARKIQWRCIPSERSPPDYDRRTDERGHFMKKR